MQRYFFHMASRRESVEDYEGRDCRSFYDAYQHACGIITTTLTYVQVDGADRWFVRVNSPTECSELIVLFPASARDRCWFPVTMTSAARWQMI